MLDLKRKLIEERILLIILKGNNDLSIFSDLKSCLEKLDISATFIYFKTFYFSSLSEARLFFNHFYGERVFKSILENYSKYISYTSPEGVLTSVLRELVYKPFHIVLLKLGSRLDLNKALKEVRPIALETCFQI